MVLQSLLLKLCIWINFKENQMKRMIRKLNNSFYYNTKKDQFIDFEEKFDGWMYEFSNHKCTSRRFHCGHFGRIHSLEDTHGCTAPYTLLMIAHHPIFSCLHCQTHRNELLLGTRPPISINN